MVSNNKNVEDPFTDFVTFDLNVTRIPYVQFYSKAKLVDTFHCDATSGCSFPLLKTKMVAFYNDHEADVATPQADEEQPNESKQSDMQQEQVRHQSQRLNTWLHRFLGTRMS